MNTLEQWTKENLGDSLADIAEHGANAGFPGITYYSDTVELYNEHADEIWEKLYEDAEQLGLNNPIELIATFGGREDVSTDQQFKNLLVWYYVERVANEADND